MANARICALGPSPTQGNVCLLAVDSISDLHSVPLDMETPQGDEGLSDACSEISMSPPPCKPQAPKAEHPAGRGRCASPCMTALLTILIVIALVNTSLLLYILHLYRDQDHLLRTLAEEFGTQMDSLQQQIQGAVVTVDLGLRTLQGHGRDMDM